MRYQNSDPTELHGVLDILRWKLGLLPPEPTVGIAAPDQPAASRAVRIERLWRSPRRGWRVTWLGHSSFLCQSAQVNLLVDPIFSDYCSPVPIPTLKRHCPPPLAMGELPRIDLILLSHTHYDHLDLPSLRRMGRDVPLVVPQGHAGWLARRGFRDVRELAWWQTCEVSRGLRITATPAQHFTARTPWDRNRGHWCGWFLQGSGTALWHAGDTAWFPGLAEISQRCGSPDFAMIPIGAYQPRRVMKSVHMNPEEAVQVFRDLGCRRAVAMHWGTFRLTDEPLGEPPLRLRAALRQHGLAEHRFVAGACGQSWPVAGR